MPKKTRKMKQRASMRRSVPAGEPSTLEQEEDAPQTTLTNRTILQSVSRVITPATYDYSHVFSDLKRIALFAGFFFAVLIALSFVIK